jgi:glycosyltransferase involved in cell wall biosynthesis
MRFLIFTQKVDREDDVLGFFHGWIEKIAAKVDYLHVVCLYEGQHKLPSNVKVWSLGKESSRSKIRQFFRFYRYIWKLRNEYDVIFVHMNPIYIFLGGIFWKIYRKKIYLWHNHQQGSFITKTAINLSNTAFHTSPFAFTGRFKNSKMMPAGIDTDIFRDDEKIRKILNSILFIGRFSPIKNIEILIEAAKLMHQDGVDFTLNIVGEVERGGGEKYFEHIKNLSKELEEMGKIRFLGKISNYKTPEIYNQNEVLVNLSPAGAFDKTILEAMACGSLVLVSSPAFKDILPENMIFQEKNAKDLKNKIISLFDLTKSGGRGVGRELREKVIQSHNLDVLIKRLIEDFGK